MELEDAINRRTQVDYLLLADHAAVAEGKLYLAGGGWDRITPPGLPHSMVIGIAVGIRVPYTETDDAHSVRIVVERGGDAVPLVQIQGDLEVGRPPGSRGRDVLVPMAFNVPVTFEAADDLVLVASVDGREARRYPFRVEDRGRRA
jgi:hypothetical protein